MLAHHVIVQVTHALVSLVAVLAPERLLPGVNQKVGGEVATGEEGLRACVALEGPVLGGVVASHVGAQVGLGGPELCAPRAGEDARLGLASVGAQVGHQLGAEHEASVAVRAANRPIRGMHRLHMIPQAVAGGEALAAVLTLVPHLAHSVHGDHVQLQLKVPGELLLALATWVQRSWRLRFLLLFFGFRLRAFRTRSSTSHFRFFRFLLGEILGEFLSRLTVPRL